MTEEINFIEFLCPFSLHFPPNRLANDRKSFQTANLLDKHKNEQEMDVPNDFSENLLDYTRQEFKLDYDDIHTMITEYQVCFPGGTCTDVGDIGQVCCPF